MSIHRWCVVLVCTDRVCSVVVRKHLVSYLTLQRGSILVLEMRVHYYPRCYYHLYYCSFIQRHWTCKTANLSKLSHQQLSPPLPAHSVMQVLC